MFSQQQNVVQFTSMVFKLGMYYLKMALCGVVMPKHVGVNWLL